MNINPMNAFREIRDTMSDILDRADASLDEHEKRVATALKEYCESRLSADHHSTAMTHAESV